jgi:hypothetical protein
MTREEQQSLEERVEAARDKLEDAAQELSDATYELNRRYAYDRDTARMAMATLDTGWEPDTETEFDEALFMTKPPVDDEGHAWSFRICREGTKWFVIGDVNMSIDHKSLEEAKASVLQALLDARAFQEKRIWGREE